MNKSCIHTDYELELIDIYKGLYPRRAERVHCIYTVGYYSLIKRNELFIHTTIIYTYDNMVGSQNSYAEGKEPPHPQKVHIV